MNSPTNTIPEGLDLVDAPDGPVIRKVWLTWKVVPLAFFAVFWDGFLVFWYVQAFSKPNPQLMSVLFPLGHVAVGLGLTYYVIASLVNRTDILITRFAVRVATGPAPWIGNKEVKAGDITDVLVRERSANRGSRTYSVMYADPSRKERKLVASLSESDQAEFVAQMIRTTLGIRKAE